MNGRPNAGHGVVHHLHHAPVYIFDVSYETWAGERLEVCEGAELHPVLARVDYMAWVSDFRARPQPKGKQRAAIKAFGGTIKGVKAATRYYGVRLRTVTVMDGLRALQRGGLATDPRELNRAYQELTT